MRQFSPLLLRWEALSRHCRAGRSRAERQHANRRIRGRATRLEALEQRALLSLGGVELPSAAEVLRLKGLGMTLGPAVEDQGLWVDFNAADGLDPDAEADFKLTKASAEKIVGQVSIPGAWLEAVALGDLEFSRLTVPGCGYTNVIGAPRLPVLRSVLAVADGAEVTAKVTGEARMLSLIDVGMPLPLAPVQAPVPKLPGALEAAPLDLDQAAYATDRLGPETSVRVVEAGELAGQRLVMLEVTPIAYNPVAQAVGIYDTLTVNVSIRGGEKDSPVLSAREDAWLAGAAVNHLPEKSQTKAGGRLLIVAHSDFYGDLDTFVDHKEALGWTVDLCGTATAGTTATAIRSYIQNRYNNVGLRPDAVLLVGDTDRIPAFTGSGTGTPATDLYYGCMGTGDDWYPEFSVGRFSVANAAQLADVVAKTIDYESSTYGSWTSQAAFLAGNDHYSLTEGTHNWVIGNHLNGAGYTSDRLYEVTYSATTQDVRDALNNGRAWAVYSGHGSTRSWADGPAFEQNDVRNLTNGDMAPFVSSFACVTGSYTIAECFMETWLREPNGGAVVAVGSSVNSWWTEDDILERKLFDAIYDDGYAAHGDAWLRAKELYRGYFGVSADTRRYFEMYNLFGDPTVALVGLRDDGYEPNDSLADAYDLSSREGTWLSSVGGMGIQRDDDWYGISVASDALRLVAEVTFNDADGNVDLALYDDSGTLLQSSTSLTDSERIDYAVPSAGTYYLRVYHGNRGNLYDLRWDGLQPQIDLFGAAFDLPGSEQTAAGSTLDVAFQIGNGEADPAGSFDVDFYFSTDNVIASTDYHLGTYRVDGLSGNSATGTLTKRLALPPVGEPLYHGDAWYYVGMIVDAGHEISETDEGNNRSTGSGLDWENRYVFDDAYEQNDGRTTAFDLSGFEATWLSAIDGPGAQTDDDWYRIDVSPDGGRVIVDLTFVHDAGNLDVALYDTNGGLLAVSQSATDNEHVEAVVFAVAPYYLKVFGEGAGNRYDLLWEDVAAEPLWWDQLGDGYWGEIDLWSGRSRWVDSAGQATSRSPSDSFTDAVVRTDVVTVGADRFARDLTVESGTLTMVPGMSLHLAGDAAMLEPAEYAHQLGAATGGLVDVAGRAALAGRLSLAAHQKLHAAPASLPQWYGYETRTVLRAGGGVVGAFDHEPFVGEHLGHGVFLADQGPHGRGVTYTATTVEVDLFQAAPGDANGDGAVNGKDIQAILAANKFGTAARATWLEGDFTGNGVVDGNDIQAILAANLFGTGPYIAPIPKPADKSLGSRTTSPGMAQAHDAVFAQAAPRTQRSSAWVYEPLQTRATKRTSPRSPLVAAATDRLLETC
ncbi:MAG: pre-peptidase C-terminal domain-containing protein [Pirellulales bacterium]|nr:pre-peptidase C-terminal domain-containing protein [Pirellulales bacterium]